MFKATEHYFILCMHFWHRLPLKLIEKRALLIPRKMIHHFLWFIESHLQQQQRQQQHKIVSFSICRKRKWKVLLLLYLILILKSQSTFRLKPKQIMSNFEFFFFTESKCTLNEIHWHRSALIDFDCKTLRLCSVDMRCILGCDLLRPFIFRRAKCEQRLMWWEDKN